MFDGLFCHWKRIDGWSQCSGCSHGSEQLINSNEIDTGHECRWVYKKKNQRLALEFAKHCQLGEWQCGADLFNGNCYDCRRRLLIK